MRPQMLERAVGRCVDDDKRIRKLEEHVVDD